MKKVFQLVIALTLACALSGLMVSCSEDNPIGPYSDNSSLDVNDPDGTLEVNEQNFEVRNETDYVKLCVTYKNYKGLYRPDLITIEPYVKGIQDGDDAIFYIGIGTYTVRAENKSLKVRVRLKKD